MQLGATWLIMFTFLKSKFKEDEENVNLLFSFSTQEDYLGQCSAPDRWGAQKSPKAARPVPRHFQSSSDASRANSKWVRAGTDEKLERPKLPPNDFGTSRNLMFSCSVASLLWAAWLEQVLDRACLWYTKFGLAWPIRSGC